MESDTTAIELLDRLAKTWAKWIGPSGDREQYKRMSQFAADGAAALRERDTLRAELAAALEASGANAKAWQDCVEESAIKRTHLMAEIGLTEQQRDAATARAEKAEAKLDWLIMKCHWTSEQIHIGPYAAIDEEMRKDGKDG